MVIVIIQKENSCWRSLKNNYQKCDLKYVHVRSQLFVSFDILKFFSMLIILTFFSYFCKKKNNNKPVIAQIQLLY